MTSLEPVSHLNNLSTYLASPSPSARTFQHICTGISAYLTGNTQSEQLRMEVEVEVKAETEMEVEESDT